jgi:hypothetical protein
VASLNEVRDRYVIETHLDNQIDAAGAAAKRTLDALSASAAEAAKRTIEAGEATGTSGRHIEESQQHMAKFGLTAHETGFIMRVFAVDAVAGFSALAAGASLASVATMEISRLGAELILSRHGFRIFQQEASAAIAAIGGWSVAGPIAAIAAIGAGLALAGAMSESSERKFAALSVQLSATRSDAVAMANEVKAAAQAASATGQISTSGATAAGYEIAGSQNFAGTQQDLQRLILDSQRLGEVMGDAAKGPATFRAALDNAGKTAQELADQHFPGFTQALADNVQQMQDTGDATGAAQKVIDELRQTTDKVPESLTAIQKALEELSQAFSDPGANGKSFAKELGEAINQAVAVTISGIANIVKVIRDSAAAMRSQLPELAPGISIDPATGKASHSATTTPEQSQQRLIASTQGEQFGPAAPTEEQIQGIKAATEAQKNLNDIIQTGTKVANSHYETITKLENQNKSFLDVISKLNPENAKEAAQINKLTVAYFVNNEEINKLSGSVQKHTAAHKEHLDVITKDTEKLKDQISEQQRLAGAYGQGSDAVAAITVQFKAEAMALSEGLIPGKQKYIERIQQLIPLLKELSQAEESVGIQKQIETQQKQIGVLDEQTKELGQNTDVAAQNMTTFKALAEVKDKYNTTSEKEKQTYVDNAVKITDMTRAYEQQRNSVDEVANFTVNAMDTIGNAITASFVQGSASAVNWGNLMKSVVAQVIQEFAKLAILNPILNSVFGGTRGTLSSAFGGVGSVLGTGGDLTSVMGALRSGAVPGGGGGSGGLSNIMSLASLGSRFTGIGQSVGGNIMDMLPSGLQSVLNTQLIGGLAGGQFGPVTAGLAAGGEGLPASLTLGGLLGGAGAGFGVGSLAGGFIQSALGKTGPAPTIGAGVGALGGAAIGSIIPGIGTLVGGLLGGLLGGGGGGLIGPKPASPYSSTGVSIDQQGMLQLGATFSQKVDATAERSATEATIASLNTMMQGMGLTATSLGGISQIGQNTPGGFQDPSKAATLAGAFSSMRFASSDPHTQAFLTAQGGAWPDAQTLTTTIGIVKQFIATVAGTDFNQKIDATLTTYGHLAGTDLSTQLGAVATFVTTTVPSLLAVGTPIGTVAAAIGALNDQFAPAIAQAQQLGYKEAELTDARDKAIAAVTKEIAFSGAQQNQQFVNRALAAGATLSGNPADARAAALAAFDTQAEQQRHDLSASLIAQWQPSTADAWKNVNSVIALQETALGKERLAIAKQYDDAIVASAKQAADTAAAEAKAAADAAAASQAQLVANTAITWANNNAVYGRYLTARAANDNNATEAYAAQLYNFDAQAQQQRDQLSATLKAAFGDAFAQDKNYAYLVKSLDTTLAQERLQIAKQFNEQIASVSLPIITSIAQYAKGLQTGQLSPLSPQSQYALASQQFGATAGAAGRGDLTSLQDLSGAADTMLTAARALYGSGQSYVDAFNSVLDALTKVSTMTPDTLTASVLMSETRTQTQQLGDKLDLLRSEVAALRDQVRQTGNMPSRLAA